jgi:preprotein translocase subunit SecE
MADEKIEKGEPSKPKKKERHKGRGRVATWVRGLKSELKKVVWPTPKQIMNNTLVALAVMVAAAVVVWGVDQVGATIIQALRTALGPRG